MIDIDGKVMKQTSLLSNMDNDKRELVLQAAKDTGAKIRIEDVARYGDNEEHILSGHFGLHYAGGQGDYSEFWNRYDELKKKLTKG